MTPAARASTPMALLWALAGCAQPALPSDAFLDVGHEAPTCDDAAAMPIYYGTTAPTALPLSASETLSVVRVVISASCSGVIVAPRWVLTAAHCVGPSPRTRVYVVAVEGEPERELAVRAVHPHAFLDLALLELEADVSTEAPALSPVAAVPFPLSALVGAVGEAGGFGLREDGSSGARRFLAAPIVEVLGEDIVIDGGEAGLCEGDSGGPLFVLGVGGARVAGVLSTAAPSCAGRARFTRLDVARTWLESFVGELPPDDPACGSVDQVGLCRGATAVRCVDGALVFETCAPTMRCRADAPRARCEPLCR